MKPLMAALVTAATIALSGCATQRGFPAVDGLANFDVVDAKVVRCAQPNSYALKWLAERYPGATVINLRNDPWEEESVECRRLGLHYVNVPWNGVLAPSTASAEYVLKLIKDAPGVVILHCQWGADRTGCAVACYRIRHGESNAVAYDDAIKHGLETLMIKEFIKTFK